MVQGRRRQSFYEGKGQQCLPEKEWVIVRGTHEALVDEEIFNRVQERMERAGGEMYPERSRGVSNMYRRGTACLPGRCFPPEKSHFK